MLLHVPHAATWQPDALGGSSRRLLCLHELVTRHFQAALATVRRPVYGVATPNLVIIHLFYEESRNVAEKGGRLSAEVAR